MSPLATIAPTCADWGGQPGSRLGLDIGGTLTKLVFFESETRPSWCDGRIARLIKGFAAPGSPRPDCFEREEELSFEDAELGGTFHFVTFRSDHMEKFVALIEEHALSAGLESIFATGGGAYKYARLFRERLGISLHPVDELGVVIQGITWLIDRPVKDQPSFLNYTVSGALRSGSTPTSSTPRARRSSGPPRAGGGHGIAAAPTVSTSCSGFGSALGTIRSLQLGSGAVRGAASSTSVASTASTASGSTPTPASSPEPSPRRNMAEAPSQKLFPFLLVNIGSGVSVVRVDGPDRFERVSGSAIGGGTFWGLCKLLCPDCGDFEDAGRLAEQGDSSSVNLLVKDIYGGDYSLPNGAKLPGSITASFFAKAAAASEPSHAEDPAGPYGGEGSNDDSAAAALAGRRAGADADIVHALTKMISSNICQIAYLNARLHKTQRMVFTGNFLRQNPVAREAITENMDRVSAAHATRGEEPFRVLFMQHEGYFGALGTFLHNVQERHVAMSTPRVPSLRRSARELIAAAASAAAGGATPGGLGSVDERSPVPKEGCKAKCLLRRAFRHHSRRSTDEAGAAAAAVAAATPPVVGGGGGASAAAPTSSVASKGAHGPRLPFLLGGARSFSRMLAPHHKQDAPKAPAVEAL